MYVLKKKNKNTITYYVAQSYISPSTNKHTSKIVKKLGTKEELSLKLGANTNIDQWAKDYAKNYKTNQQKIAINNKESECEIKNIAYLFVKQACKEIKLDKLCKRIEKKEKLDFDLFKCLYHMITNKIVNIDLSTIYYSHNSLDKCTFNDEEISKKIEILAKNNRHIQQVVFREMDKTIYDDDRYIYFTSMNCTSIYKKLINYSTINKPEDNNIFILNIYYGDDSSPRGFSVKKYSEDNIKDIVQLDDYVCKNTRNANLIICPNAIIMPDFVKIFNKYSTCNKITFHNIDNYDNETKAWVLDPKEWDCNELGKKDEHNIIKKKINNNSKIKDTIDFYKNIFIKQKTINDEKLTVIYSPEKQIWEDEIRYSTIKYIQNKIESNIENTDSSNYKKFINLYKTALSNVAQKENDELNATNMYLFNDQVFHKNEEFDGYTSIFGNYDDKVINSIIKIAYQQTNIIEYILEDIKLDFFPKKGQKAEDNLSAHFLTVFLSIVVVKILYSKLKNKSWYYEISNILEQLNFYHVPNEGWISLFSSNEALDDLQEFIGKKIDYRFIDEHDMSKII